MIEKGLVVVLLLSVLFFLVGVIKNSYLSQEVSKLLNNGAFLLVIGSIILFTSIYSFSIIKSIRKNR